LYFDKEIISTFEHYTFIKMNNLYKRLLTLSMLVCASTVMGQTAENPWSIGVGANIVSIQDDAVDAKTSFGIPALSISRYIIGGFSLGVQFANNSIKEGASNGGDLDYYSLDGIVKYNLGEGKSISPYLFAGYGYSNFSEGDTNSDGMFPSKEVSKTVLGGAGVAFKLTDQLQANVSTSYRAASENYAYNHLQHIVGVNYNFGAGDADGDGVSDKKDVCPDVPGLKEFQGCPDTDGDGIPDNKDACPEEAGKPELNGCPDSDNDGIIDSEDACPNAAGSAAMNGCPDADGDGVADKDDQCPNEPGEAANNGCPWPDADGDGVADKDDLCPNEAGDAANNGCPEAPKALLDFIGDENSKIFFTASSAAINDAGASLVSQLVSLLRKYPNAKVTIAGHASSDGSAAYNQKLSEKRANAVRDAVIAAGIDADRVDAKGYGENQPIDKNSTRAGRSKNRRVDFARRVDIAVN